MVLLIRNLGYSDTQSFILQDSLVLPAKGDVSDRGECIQRGLGLVVSPTAIPSLGRQSTDVPSQSSSVSSSHST